MRNKRATPKINAGSMADIAFLLLIFWLVATSIVPEFGINDKLENPDEEPKIAVVTRAVDIVRVHIKEDGTYMVTLLGNEVEMNVEELEKSMQLIKRRSPIKARVIITSDYDVRFEDYFIVLELAKVNKLNIIENEIKKEEDQGDSRA